MSASANEYAVKEERILFVALATQNAPHSQPAIPDSSPLSVTSPTALSSLSSSSSDSVLDFPSAVEQLKLLQLSQANRRDAAVTSAAFEGLRGIVKSILNIQDSSFPVRGPFLIPIHGAVFFICCHTTIGSPPGDLYSMVESEIVSVVNNLLPMYTVDPPAMSDQAFAQRLLDDWKVFKFRCKYFDIYFRYLAQTYIKMTDKKLALSLLGIRQFKRIIVNNPQIQNRLAKLVAGQNDFKNLRRKLEDETIPQDPQLTPAIATATSHIPHFDIKDFQMDDVKSAQEDASHQNGNVLGKIGSYKGTVSPSALKTFRVGLSSVFRNCVWLNDDKCQMEEIQSWKEELFSASQGHPRIVTVKGMNMKKSETRGVYEISLLSEYVPFDCEEKGKSGISEFLRYKILVQLSDVLTFLHSKNIVYGDVQPKNVLLDANDDIKLCDFGLCYGAEYADNLCRTFDSDGSSLFYLAPELKVSDNKFPIPFTSQSDVYSFGIFALCLFVGMETVKNSKARVGLAERDTVPANIRPIISGCLQETPELRPKISKIQAELTKIHKEMISPAAPSSIGVQSLSLSLSKSEKLV